MQSSLVQECRALVTPTVLIYTANIHVNYTLKMGLKNKIGPQCLSAEEAVNMNLDQSTKAGHYDI